MSYIKYDVLLFSFIILLITYTHSSKYQKKSNVYLQFLNATTISVLVILVLDIFVNILEHNLINYVFVNMDKLFLTVNCILTPLASWFWTIFLFYYLTPNDKKIKFKILLASFPFVINLLLAFWNIIKPIYFYIDIENGYVRKEYFNIFTICSTFYIVYAIFLILKQRKELNKFELNVLLSFEFLPIIGGILQVTFFGALFTYPLAALSLVLVYVYLRENISILDYVSKAYSNYYFINFCNKNIIQKNKLDYSLCYIDIDSLDKINNKFGKKEGDFLLEKFVEIVNNCIEEPDFIASAGGDEFIIYFDNNDEKQILNNMKIIARNVEYFNKTSKKPFNINFTFSYFVNKKNYSPFKILKTLYYNLCNKKERKLFEYKYNSYMKEK